MSRVTAVRMSTTPRQMRTVSRSPKTSVPTSKAVMGSKAPKMAAEVEPILRMLMVMATNEMMVGNNARQKAHIQPSAV